MFPSSVLEVFVALRVKFFNEETLLHGFSEMLTLSGIQWESGEIQLEVSISRALLDTRRTHSKELLGFVIGHMLVMIRMKQTPYIYIVS